MSIIFKYIFLIAIFFLLNSPAFSQLSVNAEPICFGNATVLKGDFQPNNSLVLKWYWDLNDDGVFDNDSGQVIGFVFPQSDTNRIGLKILLSSGKDSISNFPVVVNPGPNVNFQVNNNCEFLEAAYVDQSTISSGTIDQYLWDFNNDNIIDDNSGPNVFFTVGPASTSVAKLTCISNLGCSSFATKTTEVFPRPRASYSTTNACVKDSVKFINSSTINGGNISYSLLDFGDNNIDVVASNVSHSYLESGDYQTSLIAVSDNNCKDTANILVTINPLPSVSLSYFPDSLILKDESTTISVVGDASNYLWSTQEVGSSITVSDSGSYNVLVSDINGCSIFLQTNISLKNDVISINNIITPNEDGFNDFMEIMDLEFVGPCSLSIYNRWNDLVFSTNDYKNNWSGTYDGKSLDAGTYFYSIKCKDKSQFGSINILR